ncbi:hypothetical protein FXN63_07290 [Pigmentiphaga aceris]|uniref:Uncharacterized protein n=1 Tax=Pigmentiphaga aceris TaxID=1940612 RepID=A0A5C0AU52_9BURK|nr:hypothetical protein [Pigmentiphaga aceris]QEI05665.1 hypothetical protein FXN63_07290 [Pigmentiphaga aceris]
MKAIAGLLVIAGYICFALGSFISIGYAAYLFGPGDLKPGMAIWGGFLLWIKLMGCGLLSIVLGAIASR